MNTKLLHLLRAMLLILSISLAAASPSMAFQIQTLNVNDPSPRTVGSESDPQSVRPGAAIPSASIAVTPNAGAPGSSFTARGQAAPGSAGVRILWDDGETSFGLAESPVDAQGSFNLNLKVPTTAQAGTAQLIALPLGSSGEDSGSASFTVTPSRPGSVSGRILLDRGGAEVAVPQAMVKLMDARGWPISSTESDAQGSFSFPALPQGIYTLAMSKDGYFAPIATVEVPSGGSGGGTFHFLPLDAFPSPAIVTFVGGIAMPFGALQHFTSPVLVTDQSSAKKTGVIASFASLPAKAGTVPVRFWADVSFPEETPEKDRSVVFEVVDSSGAIWWKVKKNSRALVLPNDPILGFPAYTSSLPAVLAVDMNVSSFPPGELLLRVIPYIGDKAGIGKTYIIEMTDLTQRWFQPWIRHDLDPQSELPIRYLGGGGLTYILNASLPNSSKLPFALDIPVPVFDYTFENQLGLSVPKIQEVFNAAPGKGLSTGVNKPYLHPEVKIFSKDFSPAPHLHIPIPGGNGKLVAYEIKKQVVLDAPNLLTVPLYQNGPGIGCVNLCIFGCKVCAGWKVYIDFTLGGRIYLQSYIGPELSLDTWIIPEVNGTLGGHVRVRLVVAKFDADVTGTVSVELPFRYKSTIDSVGFESPCVKLSGQITADVGFLGIGFGGGGSIGPYELIGCTSSASSASVSVASESAAVKTDPAPHVTAGSGGNALSVWVQDESTTAGQIQPYVHYRFYSGNVWLPGQRLTPSAALVHEPKAGLLANNRAVAVWVQNKRPLAEINAHKTAHFWEQEIYSSAWNGSQWSAPLALTQNEVAEGSADLAVSPNGDFAIAAWTHIQDPPPNNPDQVQSANQFSIYNGTSWSVPQSIHVTTGKIDSQVSVKVDQTSAVWAAWMRDDDADLTTFADRKILLSRRSGNRWTAPEEVPNTPPGAFSPAVALDSKSQPVLVFLAPTRFNGELTSGVGNRSALWFAHKAGARWTLKQVTLAGGTPVYAEDPSLNVTPTDQAIILFRRFGEDIVHQTGDLASVAADLTLPAVQFQGDYLTHDGESNWKISSAFDPRTLQTFVVSVKQSPFGRQFLPAANIPAAPEKPASMTLHQTAPGGPAISSLALEFLPDLAIEDHDLSFSNSHPVPGDAVLVSARISNRGFATLTQRAAVSFFDVPVTREAAPFHRALISGPLAFGESITVEAPYPVRAGGIKRITVRLDSDNVIAESDEENNSATALLGEVPPPADLSVLPDPELAALTLNWEAPSTAGIQEYRIYRAESPRGPLELVGITRSTRFVDYLVKPGAAYHYAVSVNDLFGVSSPVAAVESSALPLVEEPAPPRMSGWRSGSQIVLAWFDSSNRFELQSTENIAARNPRWSRVSERSFALDGQHHLFISPASQTRFYRLLRP